MEAVMTERAPAPLGHYSQAIVHNGLIYVSGQLPIDPKNESGPIGSIEDQTRQTLANLEAILSDNGSSKNHVLKVTIFISDISLWAAANQVYADFFQDHRPARSAVPVNDLPKGFQIEIEAIAAIA
ncbi:MAG: 2-iminobutanoate/2-iminopropanoate deaminase [Candidatus Marinamargulisbacteria bacterium]|jgi:2-iminobutanoate/2-iminopropanoate deaminase